MKKLLMISSCTLLLSTTLAMSGDIYINIDGNGLDNGKSNLHMGSALYTNKTKKLHSTSSGATVPKVETIWHNKVDQIDKARIHYVPRKCI